MLAVLGSGVGGSLLVWATMCMIDPVLLGTVGTFDIALPWAAEPIAGERLVWVAGQFLVIAVIGMLLDRHAYADATAPAVVVLFFMLAGLGAARESFWMAGTLQQVGVQLALLVWLIVQRQRSDRLAALALFLASLTGLLLMIDAQMRMHGVEVTAGDPALAFTWTYGTWSAPVLPFIGILMLAAVAALARRDPTWTPTTPQA